MQLRPITFVENKQQAGAVPCALLKYCNRLIFFSGLFPCLVFADIATDGTAGQAANLAGPQFSIPAALGTQIGTNLFHSFSVFNVATGESATFSGPNGIANVVARVTGGTSSGIDGQLASTIPLANLYLVNPSGIVFGPQATLNIGGSFYASTANYVKLSDGGRFDASNPAHDLLTTAPIAAFGFLGPNAAPISVAGSLAVPQGASLGLVGGNIDMTNATLIANGGQIVLAAVASQAEVGVMTSGLNVATVTQFGNITASNSMLDVDEAANTTSGSGSIYIRGGQLVLGNNSAILSNTGTGNGGNIDIVATGEMQADNSVIQAQTAGKGNTGQISLAASGLTLTGGAQIDSSTQTGSSGTGGIIQLRISDTISISGMDANNSPSGIYGQTHGKGDGGFIDIKTKNLNLDKQGSISASAFDSGFGGAILIDAANLISIKNSGTIAASSYGVGDGGYIALKSPEISLDGGIVKSQVNGTGMGGYIAMDGGKLTLSNGAQIDSSSAGDSSGSLGIIQIATTDSISISGSDAKGYASGIFGQVQGSGNGWTIDAKTGKPFPLIDISTKNLSLFSGGSIDSTSASGASGNLGIIQIAATDTISIAGTDAGSNSSGIFGKVYGTGNGGLIDIKVKNLNLDQQGSISASAFSSGIGGDIVIDASNLISVKNSAKIAASSYDIGNGGYIALKSPEISLDGGIVKSLVNGSGMGGYIAMDGGKLTLINGAQIDSSSSAGSTGNLGIILITTTDSIAISGADANGYASGIFGQVQGGGNGWTTDAKTGKPFPLIDISTKNLSLLNGGAIDSSSAKGSSGSLGIILIDATDTIAIAGADANSNVSGIFGKVSGSGNGGLIDIKAKNLNLDNQGTISASTFSLGVSGDVVIDAAGPVNLNNGGKISASSYGAGDAGWIELKSPELNLDAGSIKSLVNGSGKGGYLAIDTGKLSLSNGAQIDSSSSSGSSGNLGQIRIAATDAVSISGADANGNSSGIFGQVHGSGSGGAIDIKTGTLEISRNASIDAGTFSSGDSGALNVTAANSISVSSGATMYSDTVGSGWGGNITLASPSLKLDGGSIIASASASGDSGWIQANVDKLALLNGAKIDTSTSGDGQGGYIDIIATNSVSLRGASSITSQSTGLGLAGYIAIDAGLSFTSDNSSVTTGATLADGGNISLLAKNMINMNNSSITATVGTGLGNGGNILLDPLFVVMNGSTITANAFGGNGGNINLIASNFLQSANSGITASSKLGVSGTVTMNGQLADLSGSLADLPIAYLDTKGLLQARCAASMAGAGSSFVLAGRGGIPEEPDTLIPSSVLAGHPLATPARSSDKSASLSISGFGCSN